MLQQSLLNRLVQRFRVFDIDQSKTAILLSRDMKDASAQKGVEINYQLQFLRCTDCSRYVAESFYEQGRIQS